MENNKKKGRDALVVSLMGIAAGIAFIGGSAFGERFYKDVAHHPVQTKNEEVVVVAGYSDKNTLGYDEYNIVYEDSNNDYTFLFDNYAGFTDSYFEISYGEDKNTINLVRYFIETDLTEEHILEFDQKVVDSFIACFGTDLEKDTIFFILEDGSVEYLKIHEAVATNVFIPTKVSDIKNAVKHYNANACNEVTTECGRTVLLQTMDGTIYDLKKYVE